MESGETEVQTALRELFEETGLTATLDTGKAATLEYPISSVARKQVVLFPGEVQGEVVAQVSEVADYRWVRDKELQALLYPDTYEACAPLLER
jgi:8-oxo-dGTP pyrophosphatase MutT (NUDIX family)